MQKSKHTVVCLNLQSVMRPVPYCEELAILKPAEYVTLDEERSDTCMEEKETDFDDTTFEPNCSFESWLLTQENLSDLI